MPQIAPEFLTVKELADLLRVKERKVYDLASSGQVPCSRATGKLLFPAAEVRAWIADAGQPESRATRPPIVLGSHDPLLDWAIRQSRCGLASFFDGSYDGLDRFARGEGVAAGLHIHDVGKATWNIATVSDACVDQNAVLITFARRRRGLVLRPDGPDIGGLADLAGLRLTPRQSESGTDGLFRQLAADAGLDLASVKLTEIARTETDAVQSVARGDSDATFGLEAVARMFGLSFVPVIDERFDLVVDRRAYFEPPFQTLLAFCRSDMLSERAASMGGYDVSLFGKVQWNAATD